MIEGESLPVWEGVKDFGHGARRYRCMDITTRLGNSDFQYWNETLSEWRRAMNYDVRAAMHEYISENVRSPF